MTGRGWARMFARVMVGIIFFMAGYWKCFELTPMRHARGMFVEGFANTWIPTALLWALGLSIPVVELGAGGLLILGLRNREALTTIAVILLVVTYGHTLQEPLYSIKEHILPRTLLMVVALVLPEEEDRSTVDSFLRKRRQRFVVPESAPILSARRARERSALVENGRVGGFEPPYWR